MFLEHQISMVELFLMDYVTLNSGLSGNSALLYKNNLICGAIHPCRTNGAG